MWSVPPSRILVPVDFSEASGRAVETAAALAAASGAALRLLHAELLEVPAYFTQDQTRVLERERVQARARADEFLSEFAHRHGAKTFTTAIVEGAPTPTILKAAEDADLVVMGTHGRRGPARWWMGSVAERVVHASTIPVLVVRADSSGPASEVFLHPMVVATDGVRMDDASRTAEALAAAVGGQVTAKTASCAADLAGDQHASMVVVSKDDRRGHVLTHPAEQWLRGCALPMLFVPPAESA